VAGLIAELTDETGLNRYMLVRGHAALALGRLGEPSAAPYLSELLSDPEEVVRMDALLALAQLDHREASMTFLKALDDSAPIVRMAAAEGLGRIGHTASIERLRDVIEDDPNAEVRLHAAEALVRLGDERVLDRIPDVLKAVSWRVRRHPRWRRLMDAAQAQHLNAGPSRA